MNNISADTSTRPPFYARIHLVSGDGMDAGQYSEAVATLTSVALLKSSFLGFETDQDADGNTIRIAYFETHDALQAWLYEAGELFPYAISVEDVVAGMGCLWQWIGDEAEEEKRYASSMY
jgi:hypothetical protein